MKENPIVSVIIPTYNRQSQLDDLIRQTCTLQEYPHFELVIVDQSDQYDRKAYGGGLHKYGRRLKYLMPVFKGLPKARNQGILNACGDILLFLDDDTEITPCLISEHVGPYREFPDLGGVAGKVVETPDLFTNSKRLGASVSCLGRCFRNFTGDSVCFVKAAAGGNMSFNRNVINEIGLFDEGFIGTAELEETDYCYRVLKKKYKIIFNPKAEVRHLVCPQGGCRADFKERGYFRMHNIGLFVAKHKPFVAFPLVLMAQGLTIVKRVFVSGVKGKIRVCFYWASALLKGYFSAKTNNSHE